MSNLRRPRVYVPNKGAHDYSAATTFGDLVFITEGTINKFAIDTYYRSAIDSMMDSQAQDFLLIASLNSACAICSAILARRFGIVRFLLFRRNKYIERVVNVDSLLHLGSESDGDATDTGGVPVPRLDSSGGGSASDAGCDG